MCGSVSPYPVFHSGGFHVDGSRGTPNVPEIGHSFRRHHYKISHHLVPHLLV